MFSQVIWLPEALQDLKRLLLFLEKKNLRSTRQAAKLIESGISLLKDQPHIGRLMENDGQRRELFLPFGKSAYVLRYRLDDHDRIVIIRVWHGREKRQEH